MISPARTSSRTLLAIAALHVSWAAGSHWPARDAQALGRAVGSPGGRPHGPAECLEVACALTFAAVTIAGHPRRLPAVSRLGSGAAAAALTLRGAFGLAGRTDVLVPGTTGQRFKTLDRRLYSPLCLTLAAAATPSILGRES